MPEYQDMPLEQIRPPETAVRTVADEDAFGELVDSIARHGVLQPIVVRPHGERYEVVVGHRRYLACQVLQMETIPAVIREMDQMQVDFARLEENLKREDMNPLDEARHLRWILEEHNFTHREIAERIGRSRPYVSNRLRLLEMQEDLIRLVQEGHLSPAIALNLSRIKEHHDRAFYAHHAEVGGATEAVTRKWAEDWELRQVVMEEPMVVQREIQAQQEATRVPWACRFCGANGNVAYLHSVWVCDEELTLIEEFLKAYRQPEQTVGA